MTDLPTREEAREAVTIWDTTINGYDNVPGLDLDDYEKPALDVLRARANGELLSRAEWEATIKDNPVIDMGDDNLWVMVDLGNPDAVGEETT